MATELDTPLDNSQDKLKKNQLDMNGNVDDYSKSKPKQKYRIQLVWSNIILMSIIHVMTFYALYLAIIRATNIKTVIWYIFLATMGSMGVQVGAHRLWSHRAFKAKTPLKIILMILQTMALQNHIYEWSRDHRVHHKYSETDADPHNAKRGFFFAHMGWLMVRKHPDVKEKGKTIDMSDLEADPIVMFQKKHYYSLLFIFWAVLPTWLTVYFFNESIFTAFCGNMQRYLLQLHLTWLVNSAAHLYGYTPYDKTINPRESLVYLLMGEGYHNYHHTFPYDYSASEFGWRDVWNPATLFIDFFAWIGWAYDRKKVDKAIVEQRMGRTGIREHHGRSNIPNVLLDLVWGTMIYTWTLSLTLFLRLLIAPRNPTHLNWKIADAYPWFFKSLY